MEDERDPRYVALIEALRTARILREVSHEELAEHLRISASDVAAIEVMERTLDAVELMDWLEAIEYEPEDFFRDLGWLAGGSVVALPVRATVEEHEKGVLQYLSMGDKVYKVLLEGAAREEYLAVEAEVSGIFAALNTPKPAEKNREAICRALELAIDRLPNVNPSDIYQHIIYRLYLREYTKSKPEQSWVRAGGEALELFIERHYKDGLAANDIRLRALLSGKAKAEALREMGLAGLVGDSKLDVALYARRGDEWIIFGGVHCKASLAERVSDDVPCSEAMMKRGLASYLWTFDSKSFPPPQGDLVNRGELGSDDQRSDKRRYIEDHGSFDACFSYNLRSNRSTGSTKSGKRIYVSSLKAEEDPFPAHVLAAWERFVVER